MPDRGEHHAPLSWQRGRTCVRPRRSVGAAVFAVVEDDVPDDGVWMGGRMTGVFEGRTWE